MISKTLMVALAVISLSHEARGQGWSEKIEARVKSQFALTKMTADRMNFVTQGAVLILKKDNLLAVPVSSNFPPGNSYKDGRIKQGFIGMYRKLPGGNDVTRTFVAGERLFLTNVEVRGNEVVLSLVSCEPYTDVLFRASLAFPFAKGTLATTDPVEVQKTLGQVFEIGQQNLQQAQEQPPPPGRGYPPPPPPGNPAGPGPAGYTPPKPPLPAVKKTYSDPAPPPPVPQNTLPQEQTAVTKSVEIGQTIAQVESIMGKPTSSPMAAAGGKLIYRYDGLKITFENGKVKDIE